MVSNTIEEIKEIYLTAIENQLQLSVKRAYDKDNTQLYEILQYHMGWQGNRKKDKARGKRIRPLLVLLICAAAAGNWQKALPAAAAVELVHNFSLIHDDIEDNSPMRHGRPTVWKKWGISQAINVGDAMFTLAHLEVVRLADSVSLASAIKAVEILQTTCLNLTQGQSLDLEYETRNDVAIEQYWHMVEGKTAALVATSAELGAISALCDEKTCEIYRSFGHLLGLAFQAQDDYLGIWGNSALTGKSNQSDLITGKKTLPVLYGLSNAGEFARQWVQKPIHPDRVKELIKLLEAEGGKEYTQQKASSLIEQALDTLQGAHPNGVAKDLLIKLTNDLIQRQI